MKTISRGKLIYGFLKLFFRQIVNKIDLTETVGIPSIYEIAIKNCRMIAAALYSRYFFMEMKMAKFISLLFEFFPCKRLEDYT